MAQDNSNEDGTQGDQEPMIHPNRSVRGSADENGKARVYKAGDEAGLLNDEGFNEADFQYLETQGVISGFTGKKATPEQDPTVLAGRAARKHSRRDREPGPNEDKEFVGGESAEIASTEQ